MSWIYYSSTSAFWPTYMNPANGALVPPTTTYSITYMDPNNGAIYPSVTTSSSSSTVMTEGIEATGEAVSSVMSDLYYGTASASTTSYIMESTDEEPSPSTSDADASATDSDGDNGGAPSPLKIVTAAVPAVIGLALLIVGIWFCCRCKNRRRNGRGGQGGDGHRQYGEMSEVERGARTGLVSSGAGSGARAGARGMSTTSLHRPPHAPASGITRAELEGVVSPRTQWHQDQRQHQQGGYLAYPSRVAVHPASSHAGSSSRHSRWTDDSEYDVVAEDGSTITRTLSTTSTRRTIGPEDLEGASSIGHSTMVVGATENPFDHPAYTYRAAPQRVDSQRLTQPQRQQTYLAPSQSPSTYTHGGSTLSPISPATPTLSRQTQRTIEADAYSIHSSEDGMFGSGTAAAGGSARTSAPPQPGRPGLRRDPTIIRHADSFSAGPGRFSTKVERAGRDDGAVVELPPLYEDATSSWTR